MPHIRLEHSPNILEKETLLDLFSAIHLMLAEQLPTKLQSCKSRAIECDTFYLGDNTQLNAFIHVELRVAKGRTLETLNNVGAQLLSMLQNHFAKSSHALKLEISLEITELQETYFSPWKQATAKS